ncbi:hypothetical protein ABZ835_33990 [Streptomyces sp. NPDC047461]|uniref:hypothetical protein n=1 Tax=Streptomyces sp. NPDC047461 TaxID=3155619 RepID=UPI0033CA37D7
MRRQIAESSGALQIQSSVSTPTVHKVASRRVARSRSPPVALGAWRRTATVA